jgi:hypothetical protein
MKITINSRTVFTFPTSLIANRITSGFIRKKAKEMNIILTRKQAVELVKQLNRYRKTHRDWNLVEIDCQNGNSVRIKI